MWSWVALVGLCLGALWREYSRGKEIARLKEDNQHVRATSIHKDRIIDAMATAVQDEIELRKKLDLVHRTDDPAELNKLYKEILLLSKGKHPA